MERASSSDQQAAEQKAREDALVREHLPIVDYAVNHLASRLPRHVPREDLVSAAMAGLAQAARSFDPSRDTRFDSYASARIRGALLDELRQRDWASRSVRSRARKMAAAHDELTIELGRTPSTPEVAEKLGVDVGTVDSIVGQVHRSVVLNYESVMADADGEAVLPADELSPDAVLLERERRAYMIDAVAALPERLKKVVIGYFFEERPMQELAEELGVTPSRISQMRAEAIALLKEGINAHLEPESATPRCEESGRVSRRKAAYAAAVARGSDYRSRLGASGASGARLLAGA